MPMQSLDLHHLRDIMIVQCQYRSYMFISKLHRRNCHNLQIAQASCRLWDEEWAGRRVFIHVSFGHLAWTNAINTYHSMLLSCPFSAVWQKRCPAYSLHNASHTTRWVSFRLYSYGMMWFRREGWMLKFRTREQSARQIDTEEVKWSTWDHQTELRSPKVNFVNMVKQCKTL